jgi:hypothetical protein
LLQQRLWWWLLHWGRYVRLPLLPLLLCALCLSLFLGCHFTVLLLLPWQWRRRWWLLLLLLLLLLLCLRQMWLRPCGPIMV